jgi:exosortase A
MNARIMEQSLVTPSTAAVVLGRGWSQALPALAVVQLAILVLYRDTALSMVEIWARNETFTHCFLVLPITLWLVWRIRQRVALLVPRASGWAMLALAGTGFVWLLGELATVRVLSQFALTTMLVLAVPAVLGFRVARSIAFPLAFLYFAVPFGEFSMPQLMEWTANVTVLGLRLSGIPVYREGLQFVIPSGSWSVAEACSGVRYLIASLTVGTLFAYLSYHSLKRRLIFVAVSFIVPVIANWMRAYIIVMLGHLSGNKLAAGVDHLIYGWLFFGLVIMAMFWIGARWRQEPLQPLVFSTATLAGSGAASSPLLPALSFIALAAIWPLAQWQIERNVPSELTRIEPFGPIAGWSLAPEQVADWTPSFDNPSASVQSTFGKDGQLVGLYLGYYRNQDSSRKLVSSTNVLVKSKDPQWAKVAGGERPVSIDQQAIAVRSAELRSVDSKRLLVWQWYWINGHLTASDFKAKAYTALSRLMGQGDDSAVIIVYALKESVSNATGNAAAGNVAGEVALASFIQSAAPEIRRVLSVTGEKR